MSWWAAAGRRLARVRGEDGNAIVEFIGVALLLLIPLVYLVLTLGRVQAAMFAAEAGARESGRIISTTVELGEGVARARSAVELAFADQGIEVTGSDALHLECEEEPCLTRGGRIYIQVDATVRLPLVPDAFAGTLPVEVPVRAEHLAVVPEYGAAP